MRNVNRTIFPRPFKRVFRKTLAIALSILLSTDVIAVAAETTQQTCDHLAGDSVKLEAIDADHAVAACAAAVAATPQNSKLEYEYGRALERAGRLDEAKGMYQWAADDGLAPASAALARLKVNPKPAATTNDKAEREQIASRLDALAAIARKIADAAPRDHDDPIAVLAKTGNDPASILNWVRANTRLIPYAGMLRGSSGVLMDRAGNSLDRSLLLTDLIHHAGYEVRLARAQLDPHAAATLRDRMEASVPKASPPAPLDRSELLQQMGNDPRIDHAAVEKAVDRTIADSQRFEVTIKDLYGKVFPAVMQALGNNPKRDQRLAAEAEATLRDHFWVQRRTASGWEDLDPDADVVHKLTPTATLAPDQIPDALRHRVTLRLILETWSAGKLSEAKLLERSWTPSELMGKSITLSHALLPQSPIDQIAQQPDPQTKYIDDLTKTWVIEPLVRVGNDTLTDQLYTLGGQVMPASTATLARLGVANTFANFGKLQGELNQAFGSGQGGPQYGPPDETTAPVKVTAEWLEFQIDVPGRRPQRHRRAVFDLIGPAARATALNPSPRTIDATQKRQRALALSGSVDVYIFGAAPADAWITRQSAEVLARIVHTAANNELSAGQLRDVLRAAPPPRLALPLWAWAFARTDSGLLSPMAPVEPNVALLWEEVAQRKTITLEPQIVFDVVSNGAGADPDFAHRVAQGVLDTVMEHAVFGSSNDGGNAAALQALDLAAGRRWIRLDGAAAERVGKLSLAEDAKARIKSELAQGNIVIAPNEATVTSAGKATAWWRVEPYTGLTLGIGADGRGSEAAEEGMLWNAVMGGSVCSFIAVGEKLATGHGSALRYTECLASAALGAPHGITGVYAHATLNLVVATFEMIKDTAGGHGD